MIAETEAVLIARSATTRWRETDLRRLPGAGGAYALLIDLKRPARLPLARLGHPRLIPGRYVYCGSAHGPGGLAGRLRRHLAHDKALHWHVDFLTRRGRVNEVWAGVGARECDLVEQLLERHAATTPIPGFGSSDCRRCASHLLAVPDEANLGVLSEQPTC